MKRCIIIFLLFALISCNRDDTDNMFLYNGSYAVIGDSISYGKGSSHYTSWSDILRESLGIDVYKKYAVCGAVASSRYPDSQYSIKAQIESLESPFDLITVMIGINDCLLGKELAQVDDVINLPMEEIDYRKTFTHGFVYNMYLLKSRCPDSQIIVVSPPAIGCDTKISLNEYISIERIVSQKFDLQFIDISESNYSPEGELVCSDLIHPTDKGYKLLAGFINTRIKGILFLNKKIK